MVYSRLPWIFFLLLGIVLPHKLCGSDSSEGPWETHRLQHDPDQNKYLKPESKKVEVFEREGFRFTNGNQPRNPQPQANLHPDKWEGLTGLEEEKRLGLITDVSSEKVSSPQSTWPHRVFGYLKLTFKDLNGEYLTCGGTGFLVGPCHVLTAAHNLFDHEHSYGWATTVLFYPAYHENRAPFSNYYGAALLVPNDWRKEIPGGVSEQEKKRLGDKRRNWDIGMVVLDKSEREEEWIGDKIGWVGILQDNSEDRLQGRPITLSGYPGDKAEASKQIEMWEMTHDIKSVTEETLRYWIDTYPGNSGSPVWSHREDQDLIVGIHSYGSKVPKSPLDPTDPELSYNQATRISRSKFDLIVKWMEHYQPIKDKLKYLIQSLSNNTHSTRHFLLIG